MPDDTPEGCSLSRPAPSGARPAARPAGRTGAGGDGHPGPAARAAARQPAGHRRPVAAGCLRRIVEAARELVGARYRGAGRGRPGRRPGRVRPSGHARDDVRAHRPSAGGQGPARRAASPTRDRSGCNTSGGRPIARPDSRPATRRWRASWACRSGSATRSSATCTSPRVRAAEFTAEDEELLTALAATAAVAIDNARLYESARSRAGVAAGLRRDHPAIAGDRDRARRPAAADRRAQPGDRRRRPGDRAPARRRRRRVGLRPSRWPSVRALTSSSARWIPLTDSLSGRVFTQGAPLRLPQPAGRDRPGALVLARHRRRPGPGGAAGRLPPDPRRAVGRPARRPDRLHRHADLEMATSFANHAAVAIELAEARAEQQRARDARRPRPHRRRPARPRHPAAVRRGADPAERRESRRPSPLSSDCSATIGDLDDTIKQIRTTIFQLQQAPEPSSAGVRSRLLDVVTEVGPALGFAPGLRLDGVLEGLFAPDPVDDLLAVLRGDADQHRPARPRDGGRCPGPGHRRRADPGGQRRRRRNGPGRYPPQRAVQSAKPRRTPRRRLHRRIRNHVGHRGHLVGFDQLIRLGTAWPGL